jgi:hypothetical protein
MHFSTACYVFMRNTACLSTCVHVYEYASRVLVPVHISMRIVHVYVYTCTFFAYVTRDTQP